MTKPLPCPFCLSISVEVEQSNKPPYAYRVECKDCLASGPLTHCRLDSIEEWNKWAENFHQLEKLLIELKQNK